MAHQQKNQKAVVGKLEAEAFDEEYRKRQARVDPTRTHLNRFMSFNGDGSLVVEPATAAMGRIQQAADDAIATHKETAGRKPRKDAVVLISGILTVPPELRGEDADDNEKAAFWEAFNGFMHDRYGDDYVGVCVHHDETSDHGHFYWKPLVDGKLNAKKALNRRELQTWHKDLSAYIEKATGKSYFLVADDDEIAARKDSRKSKMTLEELKTETVKQEKRTEAAREVAEAAEKEAAKAKRERDAYINGWDAKKKDGSTVRQPGTKQLRNRRAKLQAEVNEAREDLKDAQRLKAEAEARAQAAEKQARDAAARMQREREEFKAEHEALLLQKQELEKLREKTAGEQAILDSIRSKTDKAVTELRKAGNFYLMVKDQMDKLNKRQFMQQKTNAEISIRVAEKQLEQAEIEVPEQYRNGYGCDYGLGD